MPSMYDSLDLSWSWKGDFKIEEGDLSMNTSDALESIENEIITIVKSSNGDWQLHPLLGANLWKFVGEPNSRKNAEKIKDVLLTSLASSGVAQRRDLDVEVNALDLHNLYIRIRLSAIPTLNNRLVAPTNNPNIDDYAEGVEIKFLFDTNTSAIYY